MKDYIRSEVVSVKRKKEKIAKQPMLYVHVAIKNPYTFIDKLMGKRQYVFFSSIHKDAKDIVCNKKGYRIV